MVYNHVNAAGGSNFDVLMPGYYFRYGANGSMSNGSGCGNETASEHAMFRKFMIDSCAFGRRSTNWAVSASTLWAVHDVETMNMLADALKLINPNIGNLRRTLDGRHVGIAFLATGGTKQRQQFAWRGTVQRPTA